jgi:type I restriction enzyme S subunit
MDACIHDGFVAFDNLPSSVNQKYLYYFFKYVRPFVLDKHKQGVTQVNLNTGIVSEMSFLLAPSREQARIVTKIEELFSELDKGIESLATAGEQLKAYRQSVLKHAFETDSADWPEFTIGQLITDIRYGTAKKCAVDPTKTPVLRIPNVASGRIDLEDLKHTDFTDDELDKLRLEQGDILLVRSNGSVSLVGLSAVVTGKAAGCAYAGYLIRLRLKREIILPEFLNLYLHSPHVRIDIERQARSTSGVHNVNSDEIRAISIRVPPIQTQQLIIGTIGQISTQIDALESCTTTELQRGAALRQSILKKAFSGQLVKQDANDEPASVLLERIRAERDAATTKTEHKTKRAKRSKKRDKAA